MGGSGGIFEGYSPKNPNDYKELAEKIRIEENKTNVQKFDSEISSLIAGRLIKFNNRDTDKIQQYLNNLIQTLSTEITGSLDIKYGGSVSKHTYIDGLSDIDSLILLNNSTLESKSPLEVKKYFYDKLKERLPNTKIEEGNLAITVNYSDGTIIQLLPAVKTNSGYKIPSPDGTSWSGIKPAEFALILRAANQKQSGKLIPTIKIVKSIISNLPESRRLSGYHCEALAIEIFNAYIGAKTTKEMLKYFFKKASTFVNYPIKDKTGQSIHVDEYLGEENSLKRKMVSDSISQIFRKIENADGARDKRFWEEILKY